MSVGIGLVGCGWVAEHWHLPALAGRDDARVVALADLDPDRLARTAARVPQAVRHASVEELVADSAVDLVAVLVPSRHHADVGVLALAAGKDVLVEKPLALTLEDCDRLIAAQEASGCLAAVGFNLRAHRLVRRARAAVASGALGRVELVTSSFTASSRTRPDAPDWRRRRALGGGVVIDQAVHHFDLWRHLLGREVEEVFAVARGDDEHAAVCARMDDGALVTGTFSDALTAANEIALAGSEGRLALSLYRFDGLEQVPAGAVGGEPRARAGRLARELAGLPETVRTLRAGGDHRASYAAQWDLVLDAVRTRGPVPCSLAEGRRAVEVQLAVVASAATGAPVRPGAVLEAAGA